MQETSKECLRLFASHLRSLHRPLVQETDLAVCFLLALRDADGLGDDLKVSALKGGMYRECRTALLAFGGLE
jgi:hypothetical protein